MAENSTENPLTPQQALTILEDIGDAYNELMQGIARICCQDYNNVLVRAPNGIDRLIRHFRLEADASPVKPSSETEASHGEN